MANILLVEDNLSYRELLRTLCEAEGHTVTDSERAEEAIALAAAYDDAVVAKRRYDLVISDFEMEGMNGYELIQALRRREDLRLVPMIMISSTSKDLRSLLGMEGVTFLEKPCPNEVVVACMRDLLERSAAHHQETLAPHAPAPRPVAPVAAVAQIPMRAVRAPAVAPAPQHGPSLHDLPLLPRLGAEAPAPAPAARAQSLPTHAPLPAAERPAPVPPPPPLPKREALAPAPETTEAKPVADAVDRVLEEALRQGASDIHFEPQENALEIRLRVDGTLRSLTYVPSAWMDAVASRVKIMAELNIADRRLPQDGQFAWRSAAGRRVKYRVSTLPALHGEKLVLRALPLETLKRSIDSLGLTVPELAAVKRVLKVPTGLVLVTGPTGSGKTTTLYTMLDALNSRDRNIVTVEDPVEYQLPGITQVQVHAGIGYTFDKVLRSFLRQDPDVMLVGEIRDAETAEIALKAAVTGHLVLSTLHTGDAPAAFHRLLSMGVPSHLVSAACRLVIGQRLLRLLCPKCKVAAAPDPDELALLGATPAELPRAWTARGCPECRGTGYSGRKSVLEVLPLSTHAMREAVLKGASPDAIAALGAAEGFVPLKRKALGEVASGATSVEEAISALFS